MANKAGDFIWYELMTNDAPAAEAFYGAVLGWKFTDAGLEGRSYRIINAGEEGIGGVLAIDDAMAAADVRPSWVGYLLVDDVDESITSILAAGGKTLMPATDMPPAGRIAMMADPQGISFYVIRPGYEGDSLAFAYDKPRIGHCAWNELTTPDAAGAMAFYTGQFGWVKDGEMDMGPMGAYEFLRHGSLIGALMNQIPDTDAVGWSYYFRVADIDEAASIVAAQGGTIFFGPDEIPGGEWVVQGYDPQGARFALVGARKS